jgi:hypothetical protein
MKVNFLVHGGKLEIVSMHFNFLNTNFWYKKFEFEIEISKWRNSIIHFIKIIER